MAYPVLRVLTGGIEALALPNSSKLFTRSSPKAGSPSMKAISSISYFGYI
jgi:hypothetical protein